MNRKKSAFTINRRLLPAKFHYFFWEAAQGTVLPFITIIAKNLGIEAQIVGVFFFVLPLAAFVIRPLLAAIADKYHMQRSILIGCLILHTASIFSINFIPRIPTILDVDTFKNSSFSCHANESRMDMCQGKNNLLCSGGPSLLCTMNCEQMENEGLASKFSYELKLSEHSLTTDNKCHELVATDVVEYVNDTRVPATCRNDTVTCSSFCWRRDVEYDKIGHNYEHYAFWWLFTALFIGWTTFCVAVSFSNAMLYDVLVQEKAAHRFGQQLLWGTISFGLTAMIVGAFNTAATIGNCFLAFYPGFYFGLALMIVDIVIMSRMQFVPHVRAEKVFKQVTRVLGNAQTMTTIIAVFFAGAFSALVENFSSWVYVDLGASSLLIGLSRGFMTFGGELPMIAASGYIIKKVGHVDCLTMVFAAYSARFLAFSFITNPWFLLPVELFHGFTFGLFYPTMTSFANILAPPGLSTTLQGIVESVYDGLGTGSGNLIGGVLYSNEGRVNTFRWYGIASAVVGALYAVIQFLLIRHEKSKSCKEVSSQDFEQPPEQQEQQD